MSVADPPPTDHDPDDLGLASDETLVAYLDGQLPSEQCEQIEQALAADADVRDRLQTLDRVWNALDALPRSTASPSFTRTTIEMAAVAAEKPKRSGWLPLGRMKFPLAMVAGILGVLVGVVATVSYTSSSEFRATRDLPIAVNAAALENAVSAEFLRGLVERYSEQLTLPPTPAIEADAERWSMLSNTHPPDRRGWLTELPPDQQDEVKRRADSFEDRSQEARDSLTALEAEISADPNADELRRAALTFHTLVSRLPAGEQARLRGLTTAQRLDEVQRKASRWVREAALDLSDDERAELRDAVKRLTSSEAFEESQSPLLEFFRRFGRKVPAGEQQLLRVTRQLGRGTPEQMLNSRAAQWLKQTSRAWEDWVVELEPCVPERAKDILAEAPDTTSRARIWDSLLRQASRESLADTFVALSNDELQQALLLPAEEFTDELTGAEEGYGFNGDRRGGPMGPPRGGPGGPPGLPEGGPRIGPRRPGGEGFGPGRRPPFRPGGEPPSGG